MSATDTTPLPAPGPSALACAALGYLLAPVFLFLLGRCHLLLGIPAALLLAFGLWRLWRRCRGGTATWSSWLVPLLVAAAWTAMGGAGRYFQAAPADGSFPDATLGALILSPWLPPLSWHGLLAPAHAPLGYLLAPAFLARLTAARWASLWLYGWTVLGVSLVLTLVTETLETSRMKTLFCSVIVLFGGLDLFGWVLQRHQLPPLTPAIQGWAGTFQFSCNTTLLFGAPERTLPAWLGAALLVRYRQDPGLSRLLPYLVLGAAFWSPVALAGLLPFLLVALVPWLRQGALDGTHGIHLAWPAPALALVALGQAALPSVGADAILAGLPWTDPGFLGVLLLRYLLFQACAWFLAWSLLQFRYRSAWLGSVAAVLAVLPLLRFAFGGEWVLGASIPALFLLCLALGQALVLDSWFPKGPRAALTALLLIGSLAAGTEMFQGLARQPWPVNLARPLKARISRIAAGLHEGRPRPGAETITGSRKYIELKDGL
jgi:hypothetical protein